MAARGEERPLSAAVRHVLDQDYPAGIELVLAVGPSRDRTREVACQLAAADSRITVIDNPTGEIPAGLNLAVAASRHPVIVRADARSPASRWLRADRRPGTARDRRGQQRRGYRAAQGVTPFQQAVAWAMTSPAGVGPARYQTGGEPGPCDSVDPGRSALGHHRALAGDRVSFLRAEDWS